MAQDIDALVAEARRLAQILRYKANVMGLAGVDEFDGAELLDKLADAFVECGGDAKSRGE